MDVMENLKILWEPNTTRDGSSSSNFKDPLRLTDPRIEQREETKGPMRVRGLASTSRDH